MRGQAAANELLHLAARAAHSEYGKRSKAMTMPVTTLRALCEQHAPAEIDFLKVDVEGNLYVCGPGGVWMLNAEGEHLGTLRLPEDPHNLAWGGADARTLYITALTSVYRIRLAVPGAGRMR